MKINLPPTANETQRCPDTGANRPWRSALPVLPARLVWHGDRRFLRALRAAEMDTWRAGRSFVMSQFKTD